MIFVVACNDWSNFDFISKMHYYWKLPPLTITPEHRIASLETVSADYKARAPHCQLGNCLNVLTMTPEHHIASMETVSTDCNSVTPEHHTASLETVSTDYNARAPHRQLRNCLN